MGERGRDGRNRERYGRDREREGERMCDESREKETKENSNMLQATRV